MQIYKFFKEKKAFKSKKNDINMKKKLYSLVSGASFLAGFFAINTYTFDFYSVCVGIILFLFGLLIVKIQRIEVLSLKKSNYAIYYFHL